MNPDFNAFVEEVCEIQKLSWELPSKEDWIHLAKGTGAYAAGSAAGGALGYALRDKILSKAFPTMNPKVLTALGLGSGALLGLAGSAALKKVLKTPDKEVKK